MQLKSIALTAGIIAVVWYWLKSREIKDVALRAAVKYCEQLELALLDQTVVLKSLRLSRNKTGNICFRRRYQFDFTSTGQERYQGTLIINGFVVEQITLAPHRIE